MRNNELIGKMQEKGYTARIVSASHVPEIRKELRTLDGRKLLDADIYKLLQKYYVCDFKDVPFGVKSIIVAASPCFAAKVCFNWRGRKIPLVIPPTYRECKTEPAVIEKFLQEMMAVEGCHVETAYDLPVKFIC